MAAHHVAAHGVGDGLVVGHAAQVGLQLWPEPVRLDGHEANDEQVPRLIGPKAASCSATLGSCAWARLLSK
jgi:hypothetical protein